MTSVPEGFLSGCGDPAFTMNHSTLLYWPLLFWLFTLSSQSPTLFAQGALTPPGAPGLTMKSLDQIEARKPIGSAPFTINTSGAYYLTANLTVAAGNAVTITASGVSLDLNGFTISSTAGSATGSAIQLSGGPRNIAIGNGFIQSGVTLSGGVFSGSGFANGIDYIAGAPANVRVSNLSVTGVLLSGVYLLNAPSSVIESCNVNTAGNIGLVAQLVRDSVGLNCAGYGITGSVIDHCYGLGVNGGVGVNGATVSNSRGDSDSSDGIFAGSVINCQGVSGSGSGINATNVSGSYGFSGFRGITAFEVSNSYGQSTGANDGISADSAHNCRGDSNTGRGMNVRNADNCRASTSSANPALNTYTASGCYAFNSGSGAAIFALGPVTNSYGETTGAGAGISAAMASNSYGRSTANGFGLSATTAIGCTGASNTGTGLSAFIGNSCTGSSTSGIPLDVANPYNMP